jgi:hypothetical protein
MAAHAEAKQRKAARIRGFVRFIAAGMASQTPQLDQGQAGERMLRIACV